MIVKLFLLHSAVHQFTEVFIPGDKDRFPTVHSREHVRIIRAWGYLGNIINLISRVTKRVHNLALDALVREVSHSGAYWKGYIEAKG